jgi:NAD(P)-dependent dehydrogenase (short-subunit alcohol dehydrogenase family)
MTSHVLTGKVALVTGAASGIGAAIAKAYRAAGAIVYCADIAPGCVLSLDVTSPAQWHDAIARIDAEHSRLDILVHCAGTAAATPLTDTSLADFRRMSQLHVEGPFIGSQLAVALMRRASSPAQGVIIAVSSIAADLPMPAYGPYGVAKAGMTNLLRALGVELGRKGDHIRTVMLHPGATRTPLTEPMNSAKGWDDPAQWQHVPLGTYARPEDIAEAALYAASDDARFLTATVLTIDGGWSKGASW